MYTRQRIRRDHVADDFHRIVLDDAHVRQVPVHYAAQQRTHSRRMHFDTQEISTRLRLRDANGRFPHAEPDLKDLGRRPPKQYGKIDWFPLVRNAERGQQRLHRARLRGRGTALSQHIASDAARGRPVGRGVAWCPARLDISARLHRRSTRRQRA